MFVRFISSFVRSLMFALEDDVLGMVDVVYWSSNRRHTHTALRLHSLYGTQL